jgi:hypothetical protein
MSSSGCVMHGNGDIVRLNGTSGLVYRLKEHLGTRFITAVNTQSDGGSDKSSRLLMCVGWSGSSDLRLG